MPEMCGLKLNALLITPVQRIPRLESSTKVTAYFNLLPSKFFWRNMTLHVFVEFHSIHPQWNGTECRNLKGLMEIKVLIFCLKLCWSLYPKVQFTWEHVNIGSGNGFAPNRWQAIIWTYDDPIYWCMCVSRPQGVKCSCMQVVTRHPINFIWSTPIGFFLGISCCLKTCYNILRRTLRNMPTLKVITLKTWGLLQCWKSVRNQS